MNTTLEITCYALDKPQSPCPQAHSFDPLQAAMLLWVYRNPREFLLSLPLEQRRALVYAIMAKRGLL